MNIINAYEICQFNVFALFYFHFQKEMTNKRIYTLSKKS